MPQANEIEQKKVISIVRLIFYICLTLFVLVTLYALRSLIPPVVVAAFFAMTLINEVDRMERRGWRRGVAIGVIYAVFLFVISVGIWAINTIASGEMSGLVADIVPAGILHSPDAAEKITRDFLALHHIPTVLHPALIKEARHLPQMAGRWLQWVTDYLPAFAQSLVWIVIVPVMTFFMLLDFHKIIGKVMLLAPSEQRDGLLNVVTEIIAVIGNYVRGVVIVMCADIVVIYVVLRFGFGFSQYALPLAMMAGVLYTIPYFGAIVSTIGIGLTALAKLGTVRALWVTVAMIFIHQGVFDNIVAPKVIGRNVNLHPLLTLLALLSGGVLFGIGGTLLAVPVAASLQVILIHIFPQLRHDEGSMRSAEQVVKTTLSSDIQEASVDGEIPVRSRRPRAERPRAVREAKKSPSAPPPTAQPPSNEKPIQ